ncbi:ATP-binding cassette domain-containing protein [Candidatus Dojkabacteria bacterium]|jgi:ATP-binding cassette subfamily F protein 3|nr:ATP-binding cassette domain-containing protein [Candidatus Dojkabacteria bacterium]
MISCINITKEVDNRELFKNISLDLTTKSKVGLIGKNGTGKTTILKIIAGEVLPTSGVVRTLDETIGYLSQEFDMDSKMLVGEYLEEICHKNGDIWLVKRFLGKLDYDIDEYKEIAVLSGGEKMKLKLAALLYNKCTFLLLDEPTNHLDIDGIAWFKKFLNSFKGGFLMVSHDRDLLNDTVNRIYEIDQKELLMFDGNYDAYIEQKTGWIEKRNEIYRRYMKRKVQLEKLLYRAQTTGISRGKGRGVGRVKKMIERDIVRDEKKQYREKEINEVAIAGSVHNQKLVLRITDLEKSFGERKIFNKLNFEIRGNEKIWLMGKNGEGKTTLVRTILGEVKQDTGDVRLGDNMKVGYFQQKQKPETSDERLLAYFSKQAGVSVYSAPKLLSKYLFTSNDFIMPLNILSPGQQARLKFALFVLNSQNVGGYNFLILDEPANHLDIATKEVVERCIDEFKGAVILISHDVYMVKNIDISRMVKLENGVLEEI